MSKDKIEVTMNVYDIPIVVEALEEANKEIKRLNNIINELEKYTKKEIKKWKEEEKTENDYSARANILGYITGMENVQDKIEELKGDDKE